jgi:hypothetical protein
MDSEAESLDAFLSREASQATVHGDDIYVTGQPPVVVATAVTASCGGSHSLDDVCVLAHVLWARFPQILDGIICALILQGALEWV